METDLSKRDDVKFVRLDDPVTSKCNEKSLKATSSKSNRNRSRSPARPANESSTYAQTIYETYRQCGQKPLRAEQSPANVNRKKHRSPSPTRSGKVAAPSVTVNRERVSSLARSATEKYGDKPVDRSASQQRRTKSNTVKNSPCRNESASHTSLAAATQLAVPQIRRNRSPSPIWVPGKSASFAKVVRGSSPDYRIGDDDSDKNAHNTNWGDQPATSRQRIIADKMSNAGKSTPASIRAPTESEKDHRFDKVDDSCSVRSGQQLTIMPQATERNNNLSPTWLPDGTSFAEVVRRGRSPCSSYRSCSSQRLLMIPLNGNDACNLSATAQDRRSRSLTRVSENFKRNPKSIRSTEEIETGYDANVEKKNKLRTNVTPMMETIKKYDNSDVTLTPSLLVAELAESKVMPVQTVKTRQSTEPVIAENIIYRMPSDEKETNKSTKLIVAKLKGNVPKSKLKNTGKGKNRLIRNEKDEKIIPTLELLVDCDGRDEIIERLDNSVRQDKNKLPTAVEEEECKKKSRRCRRRKNKSTTDDGANGSATENLLQTDIEYEDPENALKYAEQCTVEGSAESEIVPGIEVPVEPPSECTKKRSRRKKRNANKGDAEGSNSAISEQQEFSTAAKSTPESDDRRLEQAEKLRSSQVTSIEDEESVTQVPDSELHADASTIDVDADKKFTDDNLTVAVNENVVNLVERQFSEKETLKLNQSSTDDDGSGASILTKFEEKTRSQPVVGRVELKSFNIKHALEVIETIKPDSCVLINEEIDSPDEILRDLSVNRETAKNDNYSNCEMQEKSDDEYSVDEQSSGTTGDPELMPGKSVMITRVKEINNYDRNDEINSLLLKTSDTETNKVTTAIDENVASAEVNRVKIVDEINMKINESLDDSRTLSSEEIPDGSDLLLDTDDHPIELISDYRTSDEFCNMEPLPKPYDDMNEVKPVKMVGDQFSGACAINDLMKYGKKENNVESVKVMIASSTDLEKYYENIIAEQIIRNTEELLEDFESTERESKMTGDVSSDNLVIRLESVEENSNVGEFGIVTTTVVEENPVTETIKSDNDISALDSDKNLSEFDYNVIKNSSFLTSERKLLVPSDNRAVVKSKGKKKDIYKVDNNNVIVTKSRITGSENEQFSANINSSGKLENSGKTSVGFEELDSNTSEDGERIVPDVIGVNWSGTLEDSETGIKYPEAPLTGINLSTLADGDATINTDDGRSADDNNLIALENNPIITDLDEQLTEFGIITDLDNELTTIDLRTLENVADALEELSIDTDPSTLEDNETIITNRFDKAATTTADSNSNRLENSSAIISVLDERQTSTDASSSIKNNAMIIANLDKHSINKDTLEVDGILTVDRMLTTDINFCTPENNDVSQLLNRLQNIGTIVTKDEPNMLEDSATIITKRTDKTDEPAALAKSSDLNRLETGTTIISGLNEQTSTFGIRSPNTIEKSVAIITDLHSIDTSTLENSETITTDRIGEPSTDVNIYTPEQFSIGMASNTLISAVTSKHPHKTDVNLNSSRTLIIRSLDKLLSEDDDVSATVLETIDTKTANVEITFSPEHSLQELSTSYEGLNVDKCDENIITEQSMELPCGNAGTIIVESETDSELLENLLRSVSEELTVAEPKLTIRQPSVIDEAESVPIIKSTRQADESVEKPGHYETSNLDWKKRRSEKKKHNANVTVSPSAEREVDEAFDTNRSIEAVETEKKEESFLDYSAEMKSGSSGERYVVEQLEPEEESLQEGNSIDDTGAIPPLPNLSGDQTVITNRDNISVDFVLGRTPAESSLIMKETDENLHNLKPQSERSENLENVNELIGKIGDIVYEELKESAYCVAEEFKKSTKVSGSDSGIELFGGSSTGTQSTTENFLPKKAEINQKLSGTNDNNYIIDNKLEAANQFSFVKEQKEPVQNKCSYDKSLINLDEVRTEDGSIFSKQNESSKLKEEDSLKMDDYLDSSLKNCERITSTVRKLNDTEESFVDDRSLKVIESKCEPNDSVKLELTQDNSVLNEFTSAEPSVCQEPAEITGIFEYSINNCKFSAEVPEETCQEYRYEKRVGDDLFEYSQNLLTIPLHTKQMTSEKNNGQTKINVNENVATERQILAGTPDDNSYNLPRDSILSSISLENKTEKHYSLSTHEDDVMLTEEIKIHQPEELNLPNFDYTGFATTGSTDESIAVAANDLTVKRHNPEMVDKHIKSTGTSADLLDSNSLKYWFTKEPTIILDDKKTDETIHPVHDSKEFAPDNENKTVHYVVLDKKDETMHPSHLCSKDNENETTHLAYDSKEFAPDNENETVHRVVLDKEDETMHPDHFSSKDNENETTHLAYDSKEFAPNNENEPIHSDHFSRNAAFSNENETVHQVVLDKEDETMHPDHFSSNDNENETTHLVHDSKEFISDNENETVHQVVLDKEVAKIHPGHLSSKDNENETTHLVHDSKEFAPNNENETVHQVFLDKEVEKIHPGHLSSKDNDNETTHLVHDSKEFISNNENGTVHHVVLDKEDETMHPDHFSSKDNESETTHLAHDSKEFVPDNENKTVHYVVLDKKDETMHPSHLCSKDNENETTHLAYDSKEFARNNENEPIHSDHFSRNSAFSNENETVHQVVLDKKDETMHPDHFTSKDNENETTHLVHDSKEFISNNENGTVHHVVLDKEDETMHPDHFSSKNNEYETTHLVHNSKEFSSNNKNETVHPDHDGKKISTNNNDSLSISTRKNDSISLESITQEAKLYGIFGSVMDKHYTADNSPVTDDDKSNGKLINNKLPLKTDASHLISSSHDEILQNTFESKNDNHSSVSSSDTPDIKLVTVGESVSTCEQSSGGEVSEEDESDSSDDCQVASVGGRNSSGNQNDAKNRVSCLRRKKDELEDSSNLSDPDNRKSVRKKTVSWNLTPSTIPEEILLKKASEDLDEIQDGIEEIKNIVFDSTQYDEILHQINEYRDFLLITEEDLNKLPDDHDERNELMLDVSDTKLRLQRLEELLIATKKVEEEHIQKRKEDLDYCSQVACETKYWVTDMQSKLTLDDSNLLNNYDEKISSYENLLKQTDEKLNDVRVGVEKCQTLSQFGDASENANDLFRMLSDLEPQLISTIGEIKLRIDRFQVAKENDEKNLRKPAVPKPDIDIHYEFDPLSINLPAKNTDEIKSSKLTQFPSQEVFSLVQAVDDNKPSEKIEESPATSLTLSSKLTQFPSQDAAIFNEPESIIKRAEENKQSVRQIKSLITVETTHQLRLPSEEPDKVTALSVERANVEQLSDLESAVDLSDENWKPLSVVEFDDPDNIQKTTEYATQTSFSTDITETKSELTGMTSQESPTDVTDSSGTTLNRSPSDESSTTPDEFNIKESHENIPSLVSEIVEDLANESTEQIQPFVEEAVETPTSKIEKIVVIDSDLRSVESPVVTNPSPLTVVAPELDIHYDFTHGAQPEKQIHPVKDRTGRGSADGRDEKTESESAPKPLESADDLKEESRISETAAKSRNKFIKMNAEEKDDNYVIEIPTGSTAKQLKQPESLSETLETETVASGFTAKQSDRQCPTDTRSNFEVPPKTDVKLIQAVSKEIRSENILEPVTLATDTERVATEKPEKHPPRTTVTETEINRTNFKENEKIIPIDAISQTPSDKISGKDMRPLEPETQFISHHFATKSELPGSTDSKDIIKSLQLSTEESKSIPFKHDTERRHISEGTMTSPQKSVDVSESIPFKHVTERQHISESTMTSPQQSVDVSESIPFKHVKEQEHISEGTMTSPQQSVDVSESIPFKHVKEQEHISEGTMTSPQQSVDVSESIPFKHVKEQEHISEGTMTSPQQSVDVSESIPFKHVKEQEHISEGTMTSPQQQQLIENEQQLSTKGTSGTQTKFRSKKKIKRRSNTKAFIEIDGKTSAAAEDATATAPVLEQFNEDAENLNKSADCSNDQEHPQSAVQKNIESSMKNTFTKIINRVDNTTNPSNFYILCLTTSPTEQDYKMNAQSFVSALQISLSSEDGTASLSERFLNVVDFTSQWLKDTEYQLYQLKLSNQKDLTEENLQPFEQVKITLADVKEVALEPLKALTHELQKKLPAESKSAFENLIEALQKQYAGLEHLLDANNDELLTHLNDWRQFVNSLLNIKESAIQLKSTLEQTMRQPSSVPIQQHLDHLERMDSLNHEYMVRFIYLLTNAEQLLNERVDRETSEEIQTVQNLIKTIEYTIGWEKDKSEQILNFIAEYEDTLKELEFVMNAADTLLQIPIRVNSLQHLQEEMQNHRKFFINLSHCKNILESLRDHLDCESRSRHSQLHEDLINRATCTLNKAVAHCQCLASAASKWAMLEYVIVEEFVWLQVARERIPDLATVCSTDYLQFMSLYQSLAVDIRQHIIRISQLADTAHGLRGTVLCSDLNVKYDKYYEEILCLRDAVNKNFTLLENFDENWTQYLNCSDKLEHWIQRMNNSSNRSFSGIREIWGCKAQFELHDKINEKLCKNFEIALNTIPIADQKQQKILFDELQQNWKSIYQQLNSILGKKADIPLEDKLKFLEDKLSELYGVWYDIHGVIENEEQFNLYVKKIQVMYQASVEIEEELKCYTLLSLDESEKVGTLSEKTRSIKYDLGRELEYALRLDSQINSVKEEIQKINRDISRQSLVLDQCESSLSLRENDVSEALKNCQNLNVELEDQWQVILKIAQFLHTPTSLRVDVSHSKMLESAYTTQNSHKNIKTRCDNLLKMLKERSILWENFNNQVEEVKNSVREVDFMVDLMSIHGTVDYDRLVTSSERLQDLSQSLTTKEPDLLERLHSTSDALKAVCNAEIQNEINAIVTESVTCWNNSNFSLKNLCERYQNAVQVWSNYRKNSDVVNEWVENQLSSLSSLPPEELIEQLQVYENAVKEQSEKLAELNEMIMEIASEVGIDKTSLLTDEIDLLSHKLEDVKAALTTLTEIAEESKNTNDTLDQEVTQTSQYIKTFEQNKNTDANEKDQLHNLENHLLSLAQRETSIQNIKNNSSQILLDSASSIHSRKTSLIDLLEEWQRTFRETFQQYHALFSTIASQHDGVEALHLWKEYLLTIKSFLISSVPNDYDNLKENEQICQVYEDLLRCQQSILLDNKSDNNSVTKEFEALTNLHNETLSDILNRHKQVSSKLEAWDKYRKDQKQFLTWLGNLEREKAGLNLKYIRLYNLEPLLNKIEALLEKISDGTEKLENLLGQHDVLLKGCDKKVVMSVRKELDASRERTSNLEAGLKTWREYLIKTKRYHQAYVELTRKIQCKFEDAFNVLMNVDCIEHGQNSRNNLNNKLHLISKCREDISVLEKDFVELNETEESFKDTLDPKDMKTIHHKIVLLRQQYDEIVHRLLSVTYQIREKLFELEYWNRRYAELTSWMKAQGNALNFILRSTKSTNVISCLEDLLEGVDSRKSEIDDLISSGWQMVNNEKNESAEIPADIDKLQNDIHTIKTIWEALLKNIIDISNKIRYIAETNDPLRNDINEIKDWLEAVEENLNSPIFFKTYQEDELTLKLNSYNETVKEINEKEPEITELLSRTERFLTKCDEFRHIFDTDYIAISSDFLEKRWRMLAKHCEEKKNLLFSTWKSIQEVINLCEQEDIWLNEVQSKLDDLYNKFRTTDHQNIFVLIENISVLIKSIENHSTEFKLIERSYSGLISKNCVENLDFVRNTLDRYFFLHGQAEALLGKLICLNNDWKTFTEAHGKLIFGLTQCDSKLTDLQYVDFDNDDKRDYEKVSVKLQDLEEEVNSYLNTVLETDSLGENLTKSGERPDTPLILEMMQEYRDLLMNLNRSISRFKEQTILATKMLINEQVQVETLRFETDSAVQVDTLPSEIQRKDAFSYELQTAIRETRDNIEKLDDAISIDDLNELPKLIASCQSSVDLIKHLSAILITQYRVQPSEFTVQEVNALEMKFEDLLSKINSKKEQRIQRSVEHGSITCPLCSEKNWAQLENDMWRLEQWLQSAHGTLQSNPIYPPNRIEELENIIQDHKELTLYLDSHRDIIRSLNIVGNHLAEHSSNEQEARKLQDKLQEVNSKWEDVCTMSRIWQEKLQSSLMNNKEFHSKIAQLIKWLEKMENSIRKYEPVDVAEEKTVLTEKFKKFKNLCEELKKVEPRVASLQAANQVFALNQADDEDSTLARLNDLRLHLQSLIRLTWHYTIKLGSILGHDPMELTTSIISSSDSIPHLVSSEFSDEMSVHSTSRPASPDTSSNDDSESRILSRTYRFMGRVIRASLPFQALLFLMLGAISLMPVVDEGQSCSSKNNLLWSLTPILRYPDGPPPT